ncbi:hypothetical protein ILYODFUR_025587 [Ilyodon furcidens]|uniref:Uncharacterized protein n=1 Tax=Ilyodon furcidens TaxID=33524 RepID=A0ABV0V8N7_9TELE
MSSHATYGLSRVNSRQETENKQILPDPDTQQNWKERHTAHANVCRHNSTNWIQSDYLTFLLRPPEAALIEADFPHGLQKEAGTTSYTFLRVRPGSESYPSKNRMCLCHGSAGPAKALSHSYGG